MPPNQNQFPAPPPSEPERDPYAFFMDPQQQKKSLFSMGGGSSNKKLFIIAGAVVGGLMLIIVVASTLGGGGKKNAVGLLALAQSQQEVIRVATDGTHNAQSTDLKNFATTTAVSLSSDQRLLLAEAANSGSKFKEKELELGKSAQTDTALSTAQAANTYDTTFASTMDSELADYQNKLEAAAQITTSESGSALLKKETDNAVALRKQLQSQLKP
jgi:hypothetical protein